MTQNSFSYEDFTKYFPVPRETYEKIQQYTKILNSWQKKINLVSPTSMAEVWTRHIIDSAQLIGYIGKNEMIADLGSGAGFPGLILAIMGVPNVSLVESDKRKAAFLQEAARATNTPITLINKRVENIDIDRFSLVIARGFAPLAAIFNMMASGLGSTHKLLLLKGKAYRSEVREALAHWQFEYTVLPSISDKDGVILSIHNLKKRESL